jgi:hypothetical protein
MMISSADHIARRNGQSLRFQGKGSQMMTAAMEFLDKSKVRELVLTDFILMIIPRTVIEGLLRDPEGRKDAIREVFLRETSANFSLIFLMPILSHGMQLIHDRLPALNPQGILSKAWINDHIANGYGQQFTQLLKESCDQSPQALRKQFVTRAFEGVRNVDEHLLEQLRALSGTDVLLPNQPRMVEELVELFEKHVPPLPNEKTWQGKIRTMRNAMGQEDSFLKQANAILDRHQFASVLKVPLDKPVAMTRQEWLLGLKNFTQQVVDRTLTEAPEAMLPQAEKLIGAVHRSKLGMTWLPLLATIYLARLVPVLSNALTRKLHGGQDFFPGEASLHKKPTGLKSANHLHPMDKDPFNVFLKGAKVS